MTETSDILAAKDPIAAARTRLDSVVADLASSLARIPVLEAEIARLSDDNTAQQARIAALEEECAALRGDHSDAQARLALAEVDRAQTISDLESDRDQWRQQAEELKASKAPAMDANGKESLKQSLDQAIAQIEDLLEEAG